MRVSKKTEYAVRALLELMRHAASPAGWRQTAQIAHDTGIPEKFLEQILLSLKRGGVLASRRGADGGYALKVEPGVLDLDRLTRLLEGGEVEEEGDVRVESAVLREAMARADGAARKVLAGVSLADLAEEVARRRHGGAGLDYTI